MEDTTGERDIEDITQPPYFQDIDFDSVEGITEEVHRIATRLLGIMDYVKDPGLLGLPEKEALDAKEYLGPGIEKAHDELMSALNSWHNVMWHDLDPHEKAEKLER